MQTQLKVISGKYYKYLTLTNLDADTIKVQFSYDRNLVDEVKNLEGARWNPDGKYWTIKRSQRNQFCLEYLSGKNPYAPYDSPLIEYQSNRQLFEHQLFDIRCALTRKHIILASEQGTGKTLVAFELIEQSGYSDSVLYVAPKNVLRAIETELLKWKVNFWPRMVTYDSLAKLIKTGQPAPRVLILDEVQKVKNPTAKRSQAAKYIADSMRHEYGDDCYILAMSGTPSPKSPADWWSLAEIVCPGFLREPNIHKFKQRLGLIIQKESMAGGVYPELVSWYDDENKCKSCGKFKDDYVHSEIAMMTEPTYHDFVPSVNEVKRLYERLKGLTIIHFKKDVLKDLPEKIHRIIRCKPTQEVLRAAKLIVARSKNVVTANILLRELSDGFQYQDQETTTTLCKECWGKRVTNSEVYIGWKCPSCNEQGENTDILNCTNCETEIDQIYTKEEIECPNCGGQGEVMQYERAAVQVACPKEDVLKEVLEEHDEVGRLVIYGGFTGSVDRCVEICLKEEWKVIRVDGRGWKWYQTEPNAPHLSEVNMLKIFQDPNKEHEKVVFIGQADSGGLGLTLTASPSIFYYSNTFNAESKMQSEDRIHRIGADPNKACSIIECFHLPSDDLIYENLKKKKKLQDMSLGEMSQAINNYIDDRKI